MAIFHNIPDHLDVNNLDGAIAYLRDQRKPSRLIGSAPIVVCGIIAAIASLWLLFPHLWSGVVVPLFTALVGLVLTLFWLILNTVTMLGAAVILLIKDEPIVGMFEIWKTNNVLVDNVLPTLKELWNFLHTVLQTCWPMLLFYPVGLIIRAIINRIIILSSGMSYKEYMAGIAENERIDREIRKIEDLQFMVDPLRRLSDDFEVLCGINVTVNGKTRKVDYAVINPYLDIYVIKVSERIISYRIDEYGNWDSPVPDAKEDWRYVTTYVKNDISYSVPHYYAALRFASIPAIPNQKKGMPDSTMQYIAKTIKHDRKHMYTSDRIGEIIDDIAIQKYEGRVMYRETQQRYIAKLMEGHKEYVATHPNLI